MYHRQTTLLYQGPNQRVEACSNMDSNSLRYSTTKFDFFVVSGVNDTAGLWCAVSMTLRICGDRHMPFRRDPDPTSEKTVTSRIYLCKLCKKKFSVSFSPLTNMGDINDTADHWAHSFGNFLTKKHEISHTFALKKCEL
jgi:hypothetical protein